MKKAIAIIADDPMLISLDKELQELDAEYEQRMEFLRKQKSNLENDIESRKDAIWETIGEHVKPKLPADFSKDKHHLGSRNGVIYAVDSAKICQSCGKDHGPNDDHESGVSARFVIAPGQDIPEGLKDILSQIIGPPSDQI